MDALASGHDPNRDRFLALADGAGTAALDLTPTYRPAGAAVYVDGMHLDVAGHRLAGQAIGAAITPLVR